MATRSVAYQKPWKSYQEQCSLLMSRGMQISNPALACEYLERIGYYRLSAYWYPFRVRDGKEVKDNFVGGTAFEQVVALYVFDKRLRMLTLDALERIEIALRVDVSHTLGKLDPLAHLNHRWFRPKFVRPQRDNRESLHEEWLRNHRRMVQRSHEVFVEHFLETYDELPVWVACEVWDFGVLSKLYAGMLLT